MRSTRRRVWGMLAIAASVAASGCASRPEARPAATVASDWRRVATATDRGRLRNWRDAWTLGLAKARSAGWARELERGGALFVPDAALPGALPVPGDYRCRVTKMGAKRDGLLDYVAYPAFTCRIAPKGDVSSLAKLDGSQRPVGLIFPASDTRAVFLGTLVLGDEQSALRYGQDQTRNLAGFVERIGERRWRLMLPYPAFESILDVIELVPAERPAQQ